MGSSRRLRGQIDGSRRLLNGRCTAQNRWAPGRALRAALRFLRPSADRRSVTPFCRPFRAEIADSIVESAEKDRGDRAGFLALDDQLAGIRWRLL